MPEPYTANDLLNAIAVASKTLSERKDEINRLNVFPVPDGDTGTNMSLTLETVVENLANLPIGAAGAEIRKAITTGALMGARGNSGVITSQILRGLCEGSVGHDELNADSIDAAEDRERFDALLEELGIKRPEGYTVMVEKNQTAFMISNTYREEGKEPPKTGDGTALLYTAILLFLSGLILIIAGLTIWRRKRDAK